MGAIPAASGSTTDDAALDKSRSIRKALEDALAESRRETRRAEHQLQRRVNELRTIRQLSRLGGRTGATLEELYQEAANRAPKSWRYAEVACARLVIDGREFRSANFVESPWMQAARVRVNGRVVGKLEVGYIEDEQQGDGGPFLKEEQNLLGDIAARLGRITEQRRAEDALRESENRYRRIVETALEAILSFDADWRVSSANAKAAELLGYSQAELLGKPMSDFIPEDGMPAHEKRKAARLQGLSGTHECVYLTKSGAQIWVSVSSTAILEHGAFVGSFVMATDITERKKAEAALTESQALQDAIFTGTNDLIWSVDPRSFGLLFYNSRFRDHVLQYAGVSVEHGMRPEDIYSDPEFVAKWHEYYDRAMNEGAYLTESRTPESDTEFLLSFKALRRDGAVFGISVFAKDITEQSRSTEVLRQSEERFRTLFNFANDAIMMRDPDGNLIEVNRTACERLGYSREELLTMSLADITAPEQVALLPEHLEALLHQGAAQFETAHLRRDGTRIPVEVNSTVIDTGDRRAILSIARDTSERKAAEAQRARVAVAIERAADEAALEERDRLSRELHDGLAQEMWLAKLKAGRLEKILRHQPDAAALVEDLTGAIDSGLAEARRAVKALRSAQRGAHLSLTEILRDDIEDFADRFGVPVEFSCEGELPALPARTQAEILRILHEALTNVRRHADATLVRVRADVIEGRLSLVVRDNGRGFVPARVRGDRVGLAGMRERAALIDGSLAVDARPSDGTTVTLSVPIRPRGRTTAGPQQ